MPCVTCGYNLQGLSVLAVCPECGGAVRATILALVDPLADELRPVPHPRALAAGLVAWSALGLLAAMVAAVANVAAAVIGLQGRIGLPWSIDHAGAIAATLVWISGACSLVMVYPHRGVGAPGAILAVLGAACYAPLGWVVLHLTEMSVDMLALGVRDLWQPSPERMLLRLGAAGLIVTIIACLRPNARVLVARSLALRTGRVDRQTLLAVALAAIIIAVGDLIGQFASPPGASGLAEIVGAVIMLVGAGLLGIGLAGVMVDAVRIAAAVVAPAPSLRSVLHPPPAPSPAPPSSPPEPPTTGAGR